jgi:hypothetical protein
MNLLDIITSNKRCNKKARLLIDIELDNGESMKVGEEGYILIDYGNETYHFEYNDFACKVKKDEFQYV